MTGKEEARLPPLPTSALSFPGKADTARRASLPRPAHPGAPRSPSALPAFSHFRPPLSSDRASNKLRLREKLPLPSPSFKEKRGSGNRGGDAPPPSTRAHHSPLFFVAVLHCSSPRGPAGKHGPEGAQPGLKTREDGLGQGIVFRETKSSGHRREVGPGRRETYLEEGRKRGDCWAENTKIEIIWGDGRQALARVPSPHSPQVPSALPRPGAPPRGSGNRGQRAEAAGGAQEAPGPTLSSRRGPLAAAT